MRAGSFRSTGRSARDQRGDAIVVWCLGLAVLLLPLGGISLDLWHSISDERALQAAAAAAAAGSSGLDVAAYRQNSTVRLDPNLAAQLALVNLSQQPDLPKLSEPPLVVVDPSGRRMIVQLHETVQLTLLRILLGDKTIRLTATADGAPRASGAP